MTSVKGTTGHTLGAAGAIEAIVTALSVMNESVPPTAGYAEADPECPANVLTEARTGYAQKVALSNSLWLRRAQREPCHFAVLPDGEISRRCGRLRRPISRRGRGLAYRTTLRPRPPHDLGRRRRPC